MPRRKSRVLPRWPGGSLVKVAMVRNLVHRRPKATRQQESLKLGDPLRLLGHQVNGVGAVPVHARQDGPIRTTNKRRMTGVPRPPSHTSRGVPDVGEAPRQHRRQWTGGVHSDGLEPSEWEINSLDFLSDDDASSCMSEDNTPFSSHSSCDQQVHSDVDAVRSVIDALLADVEQVSVMTPLDHLDWALALPMCVGISRPPEMLRRAVHRSRAFGHCNLEAYRQKTLASWFERKRVLDPAWQDLWEQLPSHVREVLGPKRNLLLLREMLVAAGHADETLVADLAQGFPLIGKLPRSGTLPEVSYPLVEETRGSLLWQASWRNDGILSRVAASFVSDVEVAAELDAKSQSEVESGKASEVPLTEVVKRCVVTPRFPVDEGWRWKDDNWVRRERCIDDFTASFINAVTAPGESIHHDTLDVLVALLHSAGKSRKPVRFRKDDFVGAYKTLPLRLEDLQLAVTVWRDATGSLRTMQLHCCPFGAVASVHAWHRLGAAVQCILANLFLVVYARYVDDLFSLDEVGTTRLQCRKFIGPTATATLAREVIHGLLGWELDAEKAVTNANVFVALGVQIEYVDCSQTMIFRVTEERAAKWRVEIQGYLLSQCMLPSQARKLAGKLKWGASYVFGRGARVYLAPLFYHASRSSRFLSQRLQATLHWWLCFLGKCACSSNSFVSSTVGCSHAIRRCDWRWYRCLGSSRLG